MKIGMVLDSIFPKDERVEKEARSLVDHGHEVFILSYTYGNAPKIERYKDFLIIRIRFAKFLTKKLKPFIATPLDIYSLFWRYKVLKYVKKYNLEVIHVHDLYLVGAVLKAWKKSNIDFKIISDLHENYAHAIQNYTYSNSFPLKYLIPFKKWIENEKKWLQKSDKVIAVVEEMKERLSEFCSPKKIHPVPNYIPKDFLSKEYKKDEEIINKMQEYFTVSYVGSFDKHKGLSTLIKSLKYLEDISNIKIVIVGSGRNLKDLKNLADKYGVRDKIWFEGWVDHCLLPNYYLNTDIFCIPHYKAVQTDNSSPGKLFRYMAAGSPVIVSNCKSIARVVKDSKAGLVFNSGEPDDLAQKIKLLYNDPQKRDAYGSNAKSAIMNKYNWEAGKNELLRLYKSLNNRAHT